MREIRSSAPIAGALLSPARPLVSDALFLTQLGCALTLGLSQLLHMRHSTEGVSVTWFAFWFVFLVLNLILAWGAHVAQRSRITRQTVATYAVWTVLVALNVAALLRYGGMRWNALDTLTALLTGGGVLTTLAIARRRGLVLRDPLVHGWLAVFFKAVPQLTLAWHMLDHGAAGLSTLAVIAGHVTICIRLGQLWFSLHEAGWDRNRRGSALSELANEGSWIVATAVWVVGR